MEKNYLGKVLITGASGLLGRQIFKTFKSAGCEVVGLCHSRPGPDLVQLDLLDSRATHDLVTREQPRHIIHAAAQRFPDKVEKDFESAKRINVEASGKLAEVAKTIGAKIYYISTDYVFDGENPPFKVDDKTNPLNKYGETKLMGEKAVLDVDQKNVVLRIGMLYGEVEKLSESPVLSLLETARSEKPGKVGSYEVRCPSHTEDIARILLDLAVKVEEGVDISGVYHWCGLEKLSKWDMIHELADVAGLGQLEHIEEITGPSPGAPRPRDTEFDRSRLVQLGIQHHTPFKEGIRASLAKWI